MDTKTGIPQVCEAVTFAATLLAGLERNPRLDDRDRRQCAQIRAMLEKAEDVLYGRPSQPEPQSVLNPRPS